jgi:DHA1 family bicyclomycin/chloramphenicol resistance-like MFS transporter
MFIPGVIGMMAGSGLSARLAGRLSQARTIRLGFALMLGAAGLNLAVSYLLPPACPSRYCPSWPTTSAWPSPCPA